MATIFRNTLLFNFAPVLTGGGAVTSGKYGGFSESIWTPSPLADTQFAEWANLRAGLLSTDCNIIGWRQARYDYTGNRAVPGLAVAGSLYTPGNGGSVNDNPNDCVRLTCSTASPPGVRFTMFLHSVPDNQISSGLFENFGPNFPGALTRYIAFLTSNAFRAGGPAYWFGRDKTQPQQRVMSVGVTPGVIKTQATLGAIVNDFIRLRRVYSDGGAPIKGTFAVTAVTINPDGSALYTVQGLDVTQIRSTPSGFARKDILNSAAVLTVRPSQASIRKVGRPSSLYRGRRSVARK
jgi:hypothetical protein